MHQKKINCIVPLIAGLYFLIIAIVGTIIGDNDSFPIIAIVFLYCFAALFFCVALYYAIKAPAPNIKSKNEKELLSSSAPTADETNTQPFQKSIQAPQASAPRTRQDVKSKAPTIFISIGGCSILYAFTTLYKNILQGMGVVSVFFILVGAILIAIGIKQRDTRKSPALPQSTEIPTPQTIENPNSFILTKHEQELVKAYRNNPSMQDAIDRLLELDK